MFLEASLLVIQLLVLLSFTIMFRRGTNFIGTYYSPYNWFAFFIFFWFILPQILSIAPPHNIVGLAGLGEDTRKEMIKYGQAALILFIVTFSVGYFIFRNLFRYKKPTEQYFDKNFLGKKDKKILLGMFFIGVLCTLKLGLTFQSTEGMRSQLVKSLDGKLLTATAFWGNFAFSILFAYAISNKKYLKSVILIGVFASVILLTGARGRLLWPVLISLIFLSIRAKSFPFTKIALLGLSMLTVLVLLDPIMIAIRGGRISELTQSIELDAAFSSLFIKRNFDSFSNLSLIVYFDEVSYDWVRLFSGARNAFMENYYPLVYASGVGFGVTYPGTAYLSLGWLGITLIGALFGLTCGYFSTLIEKKLSINQTFTYLVLMPWLCASGGNFVENADKMLAALFPALLWYILRRLKLK